jgi:hypothetical protein
MAYKLDRYLPVFGDFVRYVKPFDHEVFTCAVEDEIRGQWAGENYLKKMPLADFRHENPWETTQGKFLAIPSAAKSQRQAEKSPC